MKLADMSPAQRQLRDHVISTLEDAEWTPTRNHEQVAGGGWLPFELEFQRVAVGGLTLQVRLDVERERLHLALLRNIFQGEIFYVAYADRLDEALAAIVRHQDTVSASNFRELVRDVIRVCPETLVAEDEDGPMKRVVL